LSEARVGLTPAEAGVPVGDGHEVLVESGAGAGAGFDDRLYEQAGAKLVSREETLTGSDLPVKVK
jgi:alanine dehydrogenase